MTDSKPLSQRLREEALYRYQSAVERGDFETVADVLKLAETDPILDQMIVDLFFITTVQSARSYAHSSNGQSPHPNHFQEERNMIAQPYAVRQDKSLSTRSNVLVSAAIIGLLVVLIAVIFWPHAPNVFMLSLALQPSPTPVRGEVISAANVDRLMEVATISKGGAALSRPVFSPDSRYVAYENNQQQIEVWNIRTQTAEQTFEAPYRSAGGRLIAFSADGKLLASDGDYEVTVWNLETGTSQTISIPLILRLQTLSSHMEFSSDGTAIYLVGCGHYSDQNYSACNRVDVYGWDTHSGKMVATWVDPTGDKADVVLMSTSQQWAQGDSNGQLILHSLTSGSVSQVLLYNGTPITLVGSSLDGTLVSTVDTVPSLNVYNSKTGSVLMSSSLLDQPSAIRLMAFSPDHGLLATIGAPGESGVQFWNIKDGKVVFTLNATDANLVHMAAFSPDGTLLLTDSNDGHIRIWGLTSVPTT